MQPLFSVDHESRHNSYRADAEPTPPPSEDTPLLRERFPPEAPAEERDLLTTAVITVLLMVLSSGVVIGVYLLIQQSDAENVVPPVEEALQLVSRAQWARANGSLLLTAEPSVASRVVAVQTDTGQCWDTRACAQLLQKLQDQQEGELPYNFVISSDGQTFEVLGWRRRSSSFLDIKDSLVLGFIGNFTEAAPTPSQMKAAKIFLDESVSHKYLQPTFDVIGKDTKYSPWMLFRMLTEFQQWNQTLSDA